MQVKFVSFLFDSFIFPDKIAFSFVQSKFPPFNNLEISKLHQLLNSMDIGDCGFLVTFEADDLEQLGLDGAAITVAISLLQAVVDTSLHTASDL